MADDELSFLFQNGLEGELKTYTNLQNPKNSQQALEIALNFEQISTLEKKKEDITQHEFIAAACHAIVQTASIPSEKTAFEMQSSYKYMTVEGLVNGLEVKILFDTGSQIDIMSENCYERLLVKPKTDNLTCSDIICITGKKGKIKGKFNTSVRIGEFEATTVKNLGYHQET